MKPMPRTPVRNYLSGREQRRLLLLVAALGLVLYLMNEARDPRHWRWLTGEAPPAAGNTVHPKEPEETVSGPIRPLPELDPSVLKAVKDDTPFRDEEQAAWFGLFGILRDADSRALQRASLGNVTYVQLFDQPDVYRGKLVTLGGVVRRTETMNAPKNEAGIAAYTRAILEPADGSNNPIILYVLELPEGFPAGPDVSAKVTLTGYAFKRWVYTAQDGLRLAPVVLAKTLRWYPAPEEQPAPRRSPSVVVVLAGGLMFAAVLLFSVIRRTRMKHPIEEADLSDIPLDTAETGVAPEVTEENREANKDDDLV